MVNIEKYDVKYREGLYPLLEAFFSESLSEYGLVLDKTMLENLERVMTDSTFIMLEDGEVIGVIGGQVSSQVMSEERFYQEMIWYMDKKHRTKGIRLLRYLENWCSENGICQIVMARMHNSMPDQLDHFYQRCGYKPMETHYVKQITGTDG